MDTLVTIAIASYNNGKYIGRCLKSVINQTYRKLEIIIVDDGSTDNTQDIIAKYNGLKYNFINIQKENGGLSSVRQTALNMATGEYICFIDADDYLNDRYVSKLVSKLLKDNSDICVCSTKFVDEAEREIIAGSRQFKTDDSKSPSRHSSSMKLFLSDSWNKMYRVDMLRQAGVSFSMPKGLNGSDAMFNKQLALHQPLYSTISDVLYVHVIYKHSAVHRTNKNLQKTCMLITSNLIKEGNELGIKNEILKEYVTISYFNQLREAFQDVYNQNGFIRFSLIDMPHMIKVHRKFIDEKQGLISSHTTMDRTAGKLFVFLLNRIKELLPLYLMVRKIS